MRSDGRNVGLLESPGAHSSSVQDLSNITWKEDAVSREAPASLEAPITADARNV